MVPETERFVILLRHGIAEDRSPDLPDEERALSPEGHAQMKQIGRGLERALPKVQAIYSSPLLRATQTALWVSKAYRARVSMTVTDVLAPAASVSGIHDLIGSIEERRVVLVGHEPNLTGTLRVLLRLDVTQPLRLDPGGCCAVRIGADGSVSLEWILPPRILRKLGE